MKDILKTENGTTARMPVSDGEEVSWATSHLRELSAKEVDVLLDLPKAWFEGRGWSVPGSCDKETVFEFADRHGCGGLIASLAMKSANNISSGDSVLQSRYFSNLLYSEKCKRIYGRLMDQARSMEIPMSVIKGPALVLEGYGDPGARTYSDIDILVGSRQEAWRLIEALGCDADDPRLETEIWQRINHPGRIHAYLDGWELEFCYPTRLSADPMFELMKRYPEQVLKVPAENDVLVIPDPNLHMVILIQHMARHLCSRLIWFLDIAVFERYHRENLDWRWIEGELDRLQMRNIGAFISRFCRRYINPDFPKITLTAAGWNTRVQSAMTSSRLIYGRISLFHLSGFLKPFALILSPLRYFLITDPKHHSLFGYNLAANWLAEKLLYAFGKKESAVVPFLEKIIFLGLFPLACFVSIILLHNERRPTRLYG